MYENKRVLLAAVIETAYIFANNMRERKKLQ